MATNLIINYSKKLGLPGYSSHQFSVSVETEVATTSDIPAEAERLYDLLQANVDRQMQKSGFVPPGTYGMDTSDISPAANASSGDGNRANKCQINGSNRQTGPLDGRWKCSDKQRDLILKLVDEHQLDKLSVEALAVERFGHGVRLLDKLEASGLIDELLALHGKGGGNPNTNANGSYSRPANTTRVNGSAYNPNRRKDAA
jgi:hypothetical protein